ncbi:MAG: hypothetical protein Q8M65_03135 [Rhodoglobus sp.]|nr:hypothetical protein [Rhodoglobus sp.]
MPDRELQNLDAPFWTHRQAALHFGFTTATIRKYIRQGLPTYLDGTLVKPAEVIAHRLAARDRQLDTQARNLPSVRVIE